MNIETTLVTGRWTDLISSMKRAIELRDGKWLLFDCSWPREGIEYSHHGSEMVRRDGSRAGSGWSLPSARVPGQLQSGHHHPVPQPAGTPPSLRSAHAPVPPAAAARLRHLRRRAIRYSPPPPPPPLPPLHSPPPFDLNYDGLTWKDMDGSYCQMLLYPRNWRDCCPSDLYWLINWFTDQLGNIWLKWIVLTNW